MVRVPLKYSNTVFGYAKIDDEAEPLQDIGYYSVTLPKSLRRMAGQRPDIILAYLQEDPSTVHKCAPFLSVLGTQVLLVHMVMRGEIGSLIRNAALGYLNGKTIGEALSELNELRGSIGRISYVNGDKTDCQRKNIREL